MVGRPHAEGAQRVIRGAVHWIEERSGSAPLLRKALRYVFPDHWSFLLGEVALYCFIVLLATGVYLTLFFEPSTAPTVYQGSYGPLHGVEMTQAYRSVLDISFKVKAGLLIRQTHHWAADVFVVSIVLHLLRIFFTGAYRKPRDLTYLLGVTMLVLVLLEGYLGYSLVDDLLSGMGLAIGYSVALSLPFVGANVASLIWGAPFPGAHDFWPRMYIAHVLVLPVLIGSLLAVHLILVAVRHHTQFRDLGQTERTVVGVPTFPGQAPRSLGLAFSVAAVLVLLGGLVQINPIWLWGPYHVASATNGAQPDWYLGWLIGGLRLMPSWDFVIGDYTVVPNPFWGGVLFPLVVFGFLYLWPWLERCLTGEYGWFNLLERPRDRPWRTAIGVAMVSWVLLVFVAGSADRVAVTFGISYSAQIWVYRVLVFVVPPVALVATKRICEELVAADRVERFRREAEADAKGAG
jgi:ubiquinol-cytochrome c reductase cytochrome b subunit